MKISEIKELIQLVSDLEISEMELQKEEFKLILRKGGQETQVQVLPYQVAPTLHNSMGMAPYNPMMTATPALAPAPTMAPESVVTTAKGQPLKAPMVGTFYRASRPESEPFAKIGDRVKKGQTLCIIEAMKLMNEIEAEFSGIVVDILVEDGQPVEYGQPLFIVEANQ
jgi:acetyl-CoA carboxylase biotin carboxyl carrier protein